MRTSPLQPPCNTTSPVTDTGGGWGGRGRRRGGTRSPGEEKGVRCEEGELALLPMVAPSSSSSGSATTSESREHGAALTAA